MMTIDDVVDILAVSLIGAVPDDENVVISTNQGEPLVGGGTPAGKAYMNICRRVSGEDVPIMDLEKSMTIWTRFSGIFHKN